MKKLAMTAGSILASVAAFAEGEVTLPIDASSFTGYINAGKTAIVSVLTAGAVIMVCFVSWKWLKKAFNKAG